MKTISKVGTICLMGATIALNSMPALACGPFFKTAMFEYKLHPGLPLSKYANGSIEVLRPDYARSYLVVAYRYLTDKKLDQSEKKQALDLWRRRLLFEDTANIRDFISQWQKARAKVVDKKVKVEAYGKSGKYSYYNRLTQNSLITAIESLDKMIAKYGVKSKEVVDWLNAQDIVFGSGKEAPQSLPIDSEDYLISERQYQIAAFHFYRKEFDTAIELFNKISENESSRWSNIAPYLVSRAYIRKAQLSKSEDSKQSFDKAKQILEEILADKKKVEIHLMSKRLLQFVNFRIEPRRTLTNLAQRIANAESPKTFGSDLTDITKLLDDIETKYSSSDSEKKGKVKPPPTFQADLNDWIWKFKTNKKENLDYAISKWRDSKSLPWLICALSISTNYFDQLKPEDLDELLQASNTIKDDSPGFVSIAYLRSKLLTKLGKIEKAGKIVDSILSNAQSYTPTTVNLFKDLKLNLVSSSEEFIDLIPRLVAGDDFMDYDIPDWFFSTENKKEKRPQMIRISPITAQVLNSGIPVNLLFQISQSDKMPLAIKKNLLPAIWVRAVLLDKDKLANQISLKIEQLIPELKSDIRSYRAGKSTKQRKFIALYVALRNPGLRPYVESGYYRKTKLNSIDSYRDNWWSKGQIDYYYDSTDVKSKKLVSQITSRFLDEAQLKAASSEYNTLVNLGTAPNYLAKQIIEYIKVDPKDSRIPEALHRAVKATRYGSTDKETRSFSKACFSLLHKRYPKSAWTKKTPYYY